MCHRNGKPISNWQQKLRRCPKYLQKQLGLLYCGWFLEKDLPASLGLLISIVHAIQFVATSLEIFSTSFSVCEYSTLYVLQAGSRLAKQHSITLSFISRRRYQSGRADGASTMFGKWCLVLKTPFYFCKNERTDINIIIGCLSLQYLEWEAYFVFMGSDRWATIKTNFQIHQIIFCDHRASRWFYAHLLVVGSVIKSV